jgi:hypothetical protein
MPKPPLKWILTANFTRDGAVGYYTAAQTFSRQVIDVQVFPTKEEAEAALKSAKAREAEVADPYITEVSEGPNGLDLLTARERIRSLGPTVPYGHIHSKPPAVV